MPVSIVRVPNIVCAYCWKMSSYTTAYIREHLRSSADVISCPAACRQPPLQALIGLPLVPAQTCLRHQLTRWYVTGCSGRTSSSSSTRSLSASMSGSSTAPPLWSKLTSLTLKDTCDKWTNDPQQERKIQGTWNESSRERTVQETNGLRRERSAGFIRSRERTVPGTKFPGTNDPGNECSRERIVLIANVPVFPDIMPVPLPDWCELYLYAPGSCWENHEEMLSKVLPGRSY